MRPLLAVILLWASFAYGGDVVDLGPTDKVPDWAIGPLLILPVERVQDRRLIAERAETKRIGTIQQNYAEIDGKRVTFETIHLWEVPNDGYSCEITTRLKDGEFLKIRLSQSLFDQTFYYIYIERFKVGSDKAFEQKQHVVWDIKSRK
jgi:hypothetical protein